MTNLSIIRLDRDLPLPAYQTAGSVALDLYAAESVYILPGRTAKVPVGIKVEIPSGFEGQIRPRSSVSSNGVVVHLGTIDQDFRGELKVIVSNYGQGTVGIDYRDRIAQLVIAPVERVKVVEVEALNETERGNGGFGSTGK